MKSNIGRLSNNLAGGWSGATGGLTDKKHKVLSKRLREETSSYGGDRRMRAANIPCFHLVETTVGNFLKNQEVYLNQLNCDYYVYIRVSYGDKDEYRRFNILERQHVLDGLLEIIGDDEFGNPNNKLLVREAFEFEHCGGTLVIHDDSFAVCEISENLEDVTYGKRVVFHAQKTIFTNTWHYTLLDESFDLGKIQTMKDVLRRAYGSIPMVPSTERARFSDSYVTTAPGYYEFVAGLVNGKIVIRFVDMIDSDLFNIPHI